MLDAEKSKNMNEYSSYRYVSGPPSQETSDEMNDTIKQEWVNIEEYLVFEKALQDTRLVLLIQKLTGKGPDSSPDDFVRLKF